MNKRRSLALVFLLLMAVTALATGLAVAQSPAQSSLVGEEPEAVSAALSSAITYQGRLTEGGVPANGAYDFQFMLYDAASIGSQVGSTVTMNDVAVSNGLFTVSLVFGADAFMGDARWLEIWVRPGASSSAYTPLSPRQALTVAPYALSLKPGAVVSGATSPHVLRVENTNTSGSADGVVGISTSTSGRGVYGLAANYNGYTYGVVGESTSIYGIGVRGLASNSSGATSYGVYGESKSLYGSGVFGYASSYTGANYGVGGISASSEGRGLYGYASAIQGMTYGVYGRSDSTAGYGVYSVATAISGTTFGVWGQSDSTGGRGVVGLASAASGFTRGVIGTANSPDGTGVLGLALAASGAAYGVQGQSASANGHGVYGLATASTGTTYGVYGDNASTSGRGVYGRATAATGQAFGVQGVSASDNGRGVFGHATSSNGSTYGVVGQTDSTIGTGVQGFATSSTGINYGVWGLSTSTAGTGVLGQATAVSGTTFGVYGQSSSDAGYGVYGVNWSNTGTTYAIYGRSLSTSGYAGYFTGQGADAVGVVNTGSGRGLTVNSTSDTAIWAVTSSGLAGVDGRNASSTGRGVYGYATATTGTNYGVYGRTSSASGYAGYFQGNLHTTAMLSKAGGSFMIDHPLDPANQYLYHSFVESPDMMNIYNGNAVLDEQGEAWVDLPEWFEALNSDFRYQLTPIGGPGPNLYVAQEVQGNRFQIAGGAPGLRVSWQVTGIRQDAYANAHRIPVEEQKPMGERGLYLHPVELGQPAELGLDYQLFADTAQPPDVEQDATSSNIP